MRTSIRVWCIAFTPRHATPANDSDVAHTHEVLHGQETKAFLDAGYTGVDKRPEVAQAQAEGKIRNDIEWNVA